MLCLWTVMVSGSALRSLESLPPLPTTLDVASNINAQGELEVGCCGDVTSTYVTYSLDLIIIPCLSSALLIATNRRISTAPLHCPRSSGSPS